MFIRIGSGVFFQGSVLGVRKRVNKDRFGEGSENKPDLVVMVQTKGDTGCQKEPVYLDDDTDIDERLEELKETLKNDAEERAEKQANLQNLAGAAGGGGGNPFA